MWNLKTLMEMTWLCYNSKPIMASESWHRMKRWLCSLYSMKVCATSLIKLIMIKWGNNSELKESPERKRASRWKAASSMATPNRIIRPHQASLLEDSPLEREPAQTLWRSWIKFKNLITRRILIRTSKSPLSRNRYHRSLNQVPNNQAWELIRVSLFNDYKILIFFLT